MAATLWVDLVFKVAAAQTKLLELLNRARGAHGFAKTSVGVNDGGQTGNPGDCTSAMGHLAEGGQADIRQAEVSRQNRAGNINPLEPLAFDQEGDQRRKGAWEPKQFARAQGDAEHGALLGTGFGGEEHVRKCRGYRGSRKQVSSATAPG